MKYPDLIKPLEIKSARVRLGLSQAKMAELMGKKTAQVYNNFENGNKVPDLIEIKKLTKILGGNIEKYFKI